MLKQKTGRSPKPAFTWGVKSTDLAILQVTSPAELVSGCCDFCIAIRPEQQKKKVKPKRSATR